LSVRCVVACLVVLIVAYVCGRAAGILLDVNPYVTEIAAIVVAMAAVVWTAARRGS
jgi:hypothetical protein